MESVKFNYKAFQISEHLNLQEYLRKHSIGLITSGSNELYFKDGKDKFMLIMSYGVCIFANYNQTEIKKQIDILSKFASNKVSGSLSDEILLKIENDSRQIEMEFDSLTLGRFDFEVNKAIMLNLGQSVCLDFYYQKSQEILSALKESGQILGKHGKISLSNKKALQLAGRSLKIKNAIAENLYILDSPAIAWEDEFIDKLHKKLAMHLDLHERYQALENTFKIIDDNLQLYIAFNHHRESSRLEWIIIILIVIEVLDTFYSKLF